MNIDDIPLRQAVPFPVEFLHFDPKNPRFTPDSDLDKANDVEVIRFMHRRADLGELIQSISNSGYIDIEPLIVLADQGQAIVLEGNRRLAALKLLRDPQLARDADIAVSPVAAAVAKTLDSVTVYRVNHRNDAREFIGFKHINGPHRWDSLAKAQFAAEWYRSEQGTGITLKEIAARMGDRHDTIQRMVAGIEVLEQAERMDLFHVEERYPGRPFAFSHLYTALTRPGYREFLGLGDAWRGEDPQPNPVPQDKLQNLKQVMLWLYGSSQDEVRPVVVSQNPHIKQLGEVLAKPKARAIMMATNDLRSAYIEVDVAISQLEKSLVMAHQATESVMTKVSSYDGSDESLFQLSSELFDNAKTIRLVMDAARADYQAEHVEIEESEERDGKEPRE